MDDVQPDMTAATDAPGEGPTAAVTPNTGCQPAKATRTKSGLVKVGFYEVERTIGKGNYAVVKLGRHRVTKTEVRRHSFYFLPSPLLLFLLRRSYTLSVLFFFFCRHPPRCFQVAIKIIDKTRLDKDNLAKMYREIRVSMMIVVSF